MKLLYKKNVFLICLILPCVCLTSCGQIDPITPVDYSNLLLKTRELFMLCTALVSQNTLTSNGQAISRMYYAFYHLARLRNINDYNKEQGGHTKTWKKIANPNIQQFGLALKDLREKYDYDPIDPHAGLSMTKNDFANIVSCKTEAEALINEVESTLPNCHCLSSIDISNSKKDILDIKNVQNELFDLLTIMASATSSSSLPNPPAFYIKLWRRLCGVLLCKSSSRKSSRIP